MVVRMRMMVAIPLSWYVCFNADNWFVNEDVTVTLLDLVTI